MSNGKIRAKLIALTALCVILVLTAVTPGCKRVIESSEQYVPISQTTIDPVSYEFASVDHTAEESSIAALGDYYVIYNESTRIQRVYTADPLGNTTLLAELPSNEEYKVGPLSADTSKLFLYRKDPESTEDTDHYYGTIVDIATGTYTTSAQPMFELGTVCWAGNDTLFTANRRIIFFSALDFSVRYTRFDVVSMIENDPDGKYVLTGMVYDRNADRYVATVAEKPVGTEELSDLYKTKQMIVVIDAAGRTESSFYLPQDLYAPVDDGTGSPLAQTLQADSAGNVAVYASFFPPEQGEPLISWVVFNLLTQTQIPTAHRLRDGVIRGGWIYGLTMEPYSAWWEKMFIVLYSPGADGKYNYNGSVFSQTADNRYIATAAFSSATTYEMWMYPNGHLLLKAYHNENGNTRIILYDINPIDKTFTVAGALPAKSSMKYMVAGVEAGGNIVFMSDY